MKKSFKLCLSLLPFSAFALNNLNSCSFFGEWYTIKPVVLHQGKDIKDFKMRFYPNTPNVPYIGVNEFFHNFFETDHLLQIDGNTYTYYSGGLNSDFIRFIVGPDNIFMSSCLEPFNSHPKNIATRSKVFYKEGEETQTPSNVCSVSLNNYSIKIYGDSNEVYVPLTFLSEMFDPSSGYNVVYNGKDIYVFDRHGYIYENETLDEDYYGDQYYEVLGDLTKERPKDLATYVYNQLCFTFDILRGYTSQLIFGDNNLLSLGLDGLLELHYPTIKELLLSTNKSEYLLGMEALFFGLFDGGHTGLNNPANEEKTKDPIANKYAITVSQEMAKIKDNKAFENLSQAFIMCLVNYFFSLNELNNLKQDIFNLKFDSKEDEQKGFYYWTSANNDLAVIGFDGFVADFGTWDKYYNSTNENERSETLKKLVKSDTYAFIRDKLIQAKNNHINKIVLDLSTNHGGTIASLIGIAGLLNNAYYRFDMNNTLNKYRSMASFKIDVNLDGKYDEKDEAEAKNILDGLKIGVLTSNCSFSCGNLLPCVLKEFGYKIIGTRSGGGSCSVMSSATADGLHYSHSSYLCLSDSTGNNIDSGVIPDKSCNSFAEFFNIDDLSNYLETAYEVTY